MRATVVALFAAALFVPAAAQAAQPANQAVVLVSGLNSPTPFSSPAAECAGQEGSVWGPTVAPQLKQQGFNVYTAPERKGSQQVTPCGGEPPQSAYIDATAGIDQNGQALASFLSYLNQTFAVTQVQIVAHSYGGLWSRSAITQSSAYSQNVSITSLNTLGSPHTGSFAADIVEGTSGLDCTRGGPALQAACRLLRDLAQADIQYLGPEAVSELTGSYVGSWNGSQQIAACPVTPIAGTAIDAGQFIDGLVGAYYLPNDGVVGAGSAAATTAPSPYSAPSIPGLQPVTDFDVVHSAALSFLSSNNLLNQASIVDRVVQALNAGSTTNCVKNPIPPNPPTPPTPPTPPGPVTPVEPIAPSGSGTLPIPRRDDVILRSVKSKVRCKGKLVKGAPLVRSGQYEVTVAPRCPRKLKATGSVVMLRKRQGKKVTVSATGDELQVKLSGKGKSPKRIVVDAMPHKKWVRLKLKNGKATLPAMTAGDHSLPVRVTLIYMSGARTFVNVVVVVGV